MSHGYPREKITHRAPSTARCCAASTAFGYVIFHAPNAAPFAAADFFDTHDVEGDDVSAAAAAWVAKMMLVRVAGCQAREVAQ